MITKPATNASGEINQQNTEVWPIADRYKHWVFEKLDEVTVTWIKCAKDNEITPEELSRFRVACIALFIHLEEKIKRNIDQVKKDGWGELSKEVMSLIEENPMKEPEKHQKKPPKEKFTFWSKVFRFECYFIDRIGITRIDKVAKDPAEQALEETDEYGDARGF